MSERSVCTHLQLSEDRCYIKRNKKGIKGQSWKRYEYIATAPQGTEIISAPKEAKALKQFQHEGTENNDIKALKITTEGTETISARINSINSPLNSPLNSAIKSGENLFDECKRIFPKIPNFEAEWIIMTEWLEEKKTKPTRRVVCQWLNKKEIEREATKPVAPIDKDQRSELRKQQKEEFNRQNGFAS